MLSKCFFGLDIWPIPMAIIDSGENGSMDSFITRAATPAARLILYAALAAGVSYLFVQTADLSDFWLNLWKGSGVWLLAIFAMMMARDNDGWLLTGVMAFGALGDVLLERDEIAGGAAFLVAHLIAIALFWRNRRPQPAQSQLFLAYMLVLLVPLVAWFLSRDWLVVIYAFILAVMAATAWTSRFPRYRVGIGAMMFVASDLLIFAQAGALQQALWADYVIWALYFAGQVLITLGVTKILAGGAKSSLA